MLCSRDISSQLYTTSFPINDVFHYQPLNNRFTLSE